MRNNRLLPLIAALAAPALALACTAGHGTADTLFVSTAWLADHLKDPNVVILAVGVKTDYDAGHIPGSQFIEYKEIGQTGGGGLTLELPAMPKLAETFAKYGVSNDSHVIVYYLKDWVTQSSRIVMTLDAMGLGKNVSLLDGGFLTWTRENRAVTTEVPTVRPGKIEPCPQSDVIADLDFVKSNLRRDGVRILDARSPDVYSGATARAGMPAGHIAGAGNVFYNSLFDDAGKLKGITQLREQFTAAGVKPGDKVVTYCFIGQQASALYVVSRYLGYDTQLYDGSWDEWTKHPELPIEPARVEPGKK